jgi:site-specific DNA-methyltransferase (adenine-specific)
MPIREPILRFVNKVFEGEAINLLRRLPIKSIDHIITDPMYMVAKGKRKSCIYEWGPEPGSGEAEEYWAYHQAIYQECLRVLKPGGTIAWATGAKHKPYFAQWFGGHRIWGFSRYFYRGLNAFGHSWLVQRREQTPIQQPDDDALLLLDKKPELSLLHPCAKAVEEMAFLIRHLTQPGDIILDPFCGSGTTLVAAHQLGRRWIGCDKGPTYCQVAMNRLVTEANLEI